VMMLRNKRGPVYIKIYICLLLHENMKMVRCSLLRFIQWLRYTLRAPGINFTILLARNGMQ
jgi:hypothetical protein